MDVYEAIINVNMLLILLATGLAIWVVRQIMPDPIEETKVWRTILRVLPIVIGGAVALIPGLRPMDEISQSVVIGAVAGSLSSTTYEALREGLGDKIKSWLGSPQARKRMSMVPPEPGKE